MSTLEQSDIDTMDCNPEAVKFQYDFLNDGIGEDMFDNSALPEGLAKAIDEGKKILFFINPPYGRANGKGGTTSTVAKGSANTESGKKMKEEKWGACSAQLYAQFLYRIWKLNQKGNINIAIFSTSLYKTGASWTSFRAKFYQRFRYVKGILFDASHFSNTKNSWGVDFSIWKNGIETRNDLVSDTIDIDDAAFRTKSIGQKNIYNIDDKIGLSNWLKEDIRGIKAVDAPQLSAALTVKNDGKGNFVSGAFGYLFIDTNSVASNAQRVSLLSSCYSHGQGLPITKNNFNKVVSAVVARKAIMGEHFTWVNSKDEYLAPNESHPEWEQFVTDSLVYSLFHIHSFQSSLRQITYKDKLWDIKNEFFWLSREEMMEASNGH